MGDLRLGDVIDDFCIKCRRLTNHSIVSLMNASAAKVRCRTCYSDHDYRNEQAPPSKKELARQKELYLAVLNGAAVPGSPEPVVEVTVQETVIEEVAEISPVDAGKSAPAKKKAARKK